ncbi:MAG: glycine cleavage system protein GcvH [Deltaproteobacteria bacterium]|nr:glycine cleavage system protein GcvH [Deltaproteobacteria bacterium]
MYPSEYLYTKEHEWIRVEGDSGVLGITQFAQHELGDVVFVELPEVGQKFESHDEIGTIESVKAVAELYTPVSGEILEINEALIDDPAVLNDDPHTDGWLLRIQVANKEDLQELMSAEQYTQYVDEASD